MKSNIHKLTLGKKLDINKWNEQFSYRTNEQDSSVREYFALYEIENKT